MRRIQPASVLLLLLILGGAACSAEPRDERALPEVPIQGGEALQVEVDPAATDTIPPTTPGTPGTPGATPQTGDTLP